MEKPEKLPPLERGILDALRAIDSQVAREMQRTPEEERSEGVQKWGPYASRIERVASFVLQNLGAAEVNLDSILVMAQAMSKTLTLLVEELGAEGLGKVRAGYCVDAFEKISRDANLGLASLRGEVLM